MALQTTLKAVSDPVRRKILTLLKHGRMTVGDITEKFDISGPAISRHLSVLKEADLVRDERDGKFIYYDLNTSILEDIVCWVKEMQGEKGGNEDD